MFGSNSNSEYLYYAAVAAGICHGPIAGVAKMWKDKDLTHLTNVQLSADCTLGIDPQSPWTFLETNHPTQALNYNGIAYFRSPQMALDSGACLPNLSFEIYGIGINQINSSQQTVTNTASVVNPIWFNPTQGSWNGSAWVAEQFGGFYYLELNPTGSLQGVKNISGLVITFTGPSTLNMNMLVPDQILTPTGLTNKVFILTSGVSTPYTYTYDISEILNNSDSYPSFQMVSPSPFTVTNIQVQSVISITGGSFRTKYGTQDACPTDILTDLLTNPIYGVYPSFPLADFTWFQQWCLAANLMLSPVYDECRSGASILNDLMDCVHGEIVWSGGQLNLRSYGDTLTESILGQYNPNITPIYSLNDNNFIAKDGDPPVKCTRINTADAHNDIFIEFYNRANAYNTQTIEVKDQGDITTLVNGIQKGSRPKKLTCHAICDSNVAMTVAQHQLQRECYIRNTYKFTLGYQYICLEPMDLIEITDVNTQLYNIPVLIKSIEENENGEFDIEAEEYPYGVNSVVQYPVQNPINKVINYDSPAPPANTPLFLEPTEQLLDSPSSLALWIAISGPANYGGCEVWVSTDGNSYVQFGKVITNARMGVSTSALGITTDPDTSDTLGVDLSQSNGSLMSGTKADADVYNTLCYCGRELISFETAKLTGTNTYNLTYLRRGAYGSTIQNIPAGSQFVRLDGSVIKYPFVSSRIGQQLWFKFPTKNVYGGGLQDISTATAYTYTLQGTALTTPPADVTNLVYNFSLAVATISWNPIVDTRNITYQILKGPTLATAIVVGTTNTTSFTSLGDGTYYVRALTIYAESTNPPSLEITGSTITNNIIESFDEESTNPPWKGQKTGGAVVDQSGRLWLANTNGVITNTSGTYSSYQQIILPAIQTVQATFNLTAAGDNPNNLVADWPNFAAVSNVAGNYTGQTNVQVQIALSQDGTTWGAWQTFVPGKYTAMGFKTQLILTTSNTSLTPAVTEFDWSVDVPDRIDSHLQNLSTSNPGTAFTWTIPFNVTPNCQVVILNSQAGDYVTFPVAVNSTGGTILIKNAGSGVSRNVDIIGAGF